MFWSFEVYDKFTACKEFILPVCFLKEETPQQDSLSSRIKNQILWRSYRTLSPWVKGKHHGNDSDWLLWLLETQHAFPWFPGPDTLSTFEDGESLCSEADETNQAWSCSNNPGHIQWTSSKTGDQGKCGSDHRKGRHPFFCLWTPRTIQDHGVDGRDINKTHNRAPMGGSWLAGQLVSEG